MNEKESRDIDELVNDTEAFLKMKMKAFDIASDFLLALEDKFKNIKGISQAELFLLRPFTMNYIVGIYIESLFECSKAPITKKDDLIKHLFEGFRLGLNDIQKANAHKMKMKEKLN